MLTAPRKLPILEMDFLEFADIEGVSELRHPAMVDVELLLSHAR